VVGFTLRGGGVCVETLHGEGSTADNALGIVVIFNISTATQPRLKRRTAFAISKTQLDLAIFFAGSYLNSRGW
jgi:hypothetical protein